VAREAGVSTATVSRVVHGLDRVRPSTRQRVLEVIEALGYVPDSSAQSMVRKRKEVIGLVAIESRSPDTDVEQEGLLFMEEVLRGVESSLYQVGWSVLISILRNPDRPEAFRWLQKISAKVDGMLIAEGIVPSAQLARLAARIPVVLVAGSTGERHADVVDGDNRAGAMALARHLVERHGKTRLFYIAGPPEAPDARERLAGPRRDLPDAIACGNDQMAIGAIRELHTAGFRVPEDIAVVGFDDMHLGALLTPPLTTVHQPMRGLGERACSMLLERIADPALPHRAERLPTTLVIRESCGCPPSPDR
jgi:LacI family transcriptional regulator